MNPMESDYTVGYLVIMLFFSLGLAGLIAAGIEVARQVGEAVERARHPLGDALERFAFYMKELDDIERARNWNSIGWMESLLWKPPVYNEQERIQARVRRLLPLLYEAREQALVDSRRLSDLERNRTTLVRAAGKNEDLLRPAQSNAVNSDELLRPA